MKYCPLMSFAKQYAQEQYCMGEDCAMAANENGECLIKQALNFYVKEREEASKSGWKKAKLMYKDNSSCQDNKIEIVSEESE